MKCGKTLLGFVQLIIWHILKLWSIVSRTKFSFQRGLLVHSMAVTFGSARKSGVTRPFWQQLSSGRKMNAIPSCALIMYLCLKQISHNFQRGDTINEKQAVETAWESGYYKLSTNLFLLSIHLVHHARLLALRMFFRQQYVQVCMTMQLRLTIF